MNELSENVSFDSEFALAFEIQPFKVAGFLKGNFSKYSGAEWVSIHNHSSSTLCLTISAPYYLFPPYVAWPTVFFIFSYLQASM